MFQGPDRMNIMACFIFFSLGVAARCRKTVIFCHGFHQLCISNAHENQASDSQSLVNCWILDFSLGSEFLIFPYKFRSSVEPKHNLKYFMQCFWCSDEKVVNTPSLAEYETGIVLKTEEWH